MVGPLPYTSAHQRIISLSTRPPPEPTRQRNDNLADFQVMQQNARALAHNTELNQKNRDNAVSEGAFRHALG